MHRIVAALGALALAGLAGASARGQDSRPPDRKPAAAQERDLIDLSLEELLKLEVTTASRKEQRLMDVPAAIAVIRGEDLRRAGVRSIPEGLRMAPGVGVFRIDGNKYALSIRGFSDRFSNKLQVLIDGRSIYSPLFSGVFWERTDAFLEDVDRIEVIRGPGGAVWGANAVNGVINIITKHAKSTQGGLVYGGGGGQERAFGGARYGVAAGEGAYFRAYGMGYARDEQTGGFDDSQEGRGGFRLDHDLSKADHLTVTADAYSGKQGTRTVQAAPSPIFQETNDQHTHGAGGHLLLRWERELEGKGLLSAQTSYAHTFSDSSYSGEKRETLDVDVTHRFNPFEGHDFIWGLGYRFTRDELADSFAVRLDPEEESDDVVSAFVQDEFSLFGEALRFNLGCRVEHNDYTGGEVQPSGRVSLRLHERHLVWAAVSRAVRTPSRGENDIDLTAAVFPNPPAPPVTNTQVHILGNRNVQAEELVSYELGYRLQPIDTLSLDVAAFLNDYDHLRSTEPGTITPGVTTLVTQQVDDEFQGHTYGVELAATWQAAKGVRVYGAYTFFRMNLIQGDSLDANQESNEKNEPKGMAYARISLDLVQDVAIDLMGRYVGPLSNRDVDAYSEMDVRLAWRPTPALELSLVGQNLLHDEHFESNDTGLGEAASEIQRGVYFMASLQF